MNELLTTGQGLACGDIQQIVTRVAGHQTEDIRPHSGLTRTHIRTPVTTCRPAACQTPQNTVYTEMDLSKRRELTLDDNQDVATFISKAQEEWQQQTGEPLNTSTYSKLAFIEYLKKALPTPVQQKLKYVGLGSMTWENQREHMIHYTREHRAAEKAKKKEEDMIRRKLMRKQLAVLEEMKLQQASPQMMRDEVFSQLRMHTHHLHE